MLSTEFTKPSDREERLEMFLPEMHFSQISDHLCGLGVSLRGAMAVLVLDLPPSEEALNLMARAMSIGTSECGDYAAIMMRSFKPAFQKRLIPTVANSMLCKPGSPNVSADVATETLAQLGDEETIKLLEFLDANRRIACGPNEPLGPGNLGRLVARIRARTAGNR